MQQAHERPSPRGNQRKVLMGVGLGCAAVLLVIGGLSATGLFRAFTFLSELNKMATAGEELDAVTYGFALALHEGDVEKAYGMLGEAARERHTPETLIAEIQEYERELAWSLPFPITKQRLNVEPSDKLTYNPGDSDWKTSTYFRSPDSGNELALSMTIGLDANGSDSHAYVIDWEWETRTEDREADRVLARVERLAEYILNEEWESASHSVHVRSPLRSGGADAAPRLRELVPELPAGSTVHIVGVRPLDAHLMVVDVEFRGTGVAQELSFTMGERRMMDLQIGDSITGFYAELIEVVPGPRCPAPERFGVHLAASGEHFLVASRGRDDDTPTVCIGRIEFDHVRWVFTHRLSHLVTRDVPLALAGSLALIGHFSEPEGPVTRIDVFQHATDRWAQTNQLEDPDHDEGTTRGFGSSLAISGTRILVAMEPSGAGGGEVLEFGGRRERFAKTARLVTGDAGPGVVALASDDSRLVASTGDAIHIWRRDTPGEWPDQPLQAITPPEPREGDTEECFGLRLAMQGELLAASHCDESSENTVHLYRWDGEQFALLRTLSSPGGDGDLFGQSLLWDGAALLIGAPGHDDNVGRVWRFARPGDDPEEVHPIDPDTDEPSGFGWSLAAGASRVFIGAPDQNRVYYYSL